MKILVCISNVPDTTSKINFTPDGKAFDATGIQFIINPTDEFSLSKAIDLKAQGAHITVITVGDTSVEPTLRKALAIGADSAIRINSQTNDSQLVAQYIGAYVKKEQFDLILTGKESIDYNGGIVSASLAAILDYNFVNACSDLQITGNELIAERDLDGIKEKVSCALPAVIAGQKGIVAEKDLKIPNMRGIMDARAKSLTLIEPAHLDSHLETVGFEKPAEKETVKMFNVNELDALIEILRTETKIF